MTTVARDPAAPHTEVGEPWDALTRVLVVMTTRWSARDCGGCSGTRRTSRWSRSWPARRRQ